MFCCAKDKQITKNGISTVESDEWITILPPARNYPSGKIQNYNQRFWFTKKQYIRHVLKEGLYVHRVEHPVNVQQIDTYKFTADNFVLGDVMVTLDEEYLMRTIRGNQQWFAFLPDWLKTTDMCVEAVMLNVLNVIHVPLTLLSVKICKIVAGGAGGAGVMRTNSSQYTYYYDRCTRMCDYFDQCAKLYKVGCAQYIDENYIEKYIGVDRLRELYWDE
jgi:hypothetical protein